MTRTSSDLDRFVQAQNAGGTYARALAELRDGHKAGHWMWFVFPQIAGLGHSPTSRRYAIASLAEARDYLEHPLLGPRLREAAGVVVALSVPSAEAVFGAIDALKLRSSMTLFMRASPHEPLFGELIERYFAGEADPATDELLAGAGAAG